MKRFYHPLREIYRSTARRAMLHARRDAYIEYRGGKCECCGVSLTRGKAEFHHPDPSTKDRRAKDLFGLKMADMTEQLAPLKMLCSSCHRDIHDEWERRQREEWNEPEAEMLFQDAYEHYREEMEKYLGL